jgi:hypothetical protein
VSATATVTVAQPQQPAILNFQANPSSITAGQSSTLTWQTQNADQVSITGVGAVALSGSAGVSPTQTTTYTLSASNKAGQVTATATVTVTTAPGKPPLIVGFSATASDVVVYNRTTLIWEVVNATDVSISGIGKVNVVGSLDIMPADTTTYVLTASNASGQVTASVTVTVLFPATITSFTASPPTITAGQTITLTWTTQHAIGVSIWGIGSVVVNGSIQVTPTADTTYVLAAQGATGPPAFVRLGVKVNPAPSAAQPPGANTGPSQGR